MTDAEWRDAVHRKHLTDALITTAAVLAAQPGMCPCDPDKQPCWVCDDSLYPSEATEPPVEALAAPSEGECPDPTIGARTIEPHAQGGK